MTELYGRVPLSSTLPPAADEAEPEPTEELKSVVADKSEESDSPAETTSEAEEDAQASASTAQVDGGRGDGQAEGDSDAKENAAASRTGGTTGTGTGNKGNKRGIRSGTGVDHKKLNQKYGLVLHRQITRTKSYPKFARKAAIEGRVLVAITVDARGKILDVTVKSSSGHQVLDDSTLEAIRRIERFPAPPEALSWQTKTFVLPVSYKLS